MKKEAMVDLRLEKLNEQINELREILNEICITSEGSGISTEILAVSQYLDELIVEYMNNIGVDNNED